uniref:Fibronectin type-III domain-containing protein n=1 Tax=Echeneis naucrates TaxID=173247 RepID=A0A665VED5_ECHNA
RVQSVVLTVLMCTFLLHGAQCLETEEGAYLQAGALDLPWQDQLCCDSPVAHVNVEEGGTYAPESKYSESNLPQYSRCSFRSSAAKSDQHESSGTCLDILCRIDANWEKLICDVQSHNHQSSKLTEFIDIFLSISRSQKQDPQVNYGNLASDNPVVCEAKDSFTCSVALDTIRSSIIVVTVSVPNAAAPPVLLRVPAQPVKPSPPVNLSHIQTIGPELILHWDIPSDFSDTGLLRYEIRYSFNTTHPTWQVVSAPAEPRLSLDLKPRLNYTLQVRCAGPGEPPLWSDWSESHHIYLDTVSYIPEKVVAKPGDNVTVYCVFNDHSINASTAMWMLNFQEPLHRSQYHPVSQITVHPSESRMYDLLRCTQEWTIPYSQIYVEGASIGISCETNGDIDAMDCSWESTQWTKPEFRSRWADLPCDVMEERERAGETVGEMGPACLPVRSKQKTCTIQPLRMNCYKLWLEVPSTLGPIQSKPIYLSPIDYVKPHTPTHVRAVSRSTGVLLVTWEPPSLPVEGLQCQFQYHSPSMVRAQPEWKVQSPVRVPWAEVVVPDMCRVYVVQVRCMHINGTGFWSEWSDSVYSAPQNSRAPERGPDFWRILQDDPFRNQTNVTLLFEALPVSGHSYCVDGFIVQHQTSTGAVTRESIELVSSYSFEWNMEHQTVTVEAYNSLGSSASNINMTLEKQHKGRCLRSFRVLVINSTCVSLSWSLLDNSSVPLFMVVQWSPLSQAELGFDLIFLIGDFFDSEEFGFYLYPVFADGEGESMYTIAARGDPAAYLMLMIISFLSIILFVTLVLSQNQFVWRDVPNPNKCSWAKGLDFTKADTFDHLFRPPEGLSAWPLLLPAESISKVVIVDKADLSALTTVLVQTPLVSLTPDPATALAISLPSEVDQTQHIESSVLMALPPADQPPVSTDSSAQSSVTYATVLLSDPKQKQHCIHLNYKDGSGSSSSDEGNFSANNSDISGSFPGGLWELDSCRGGEMEDPRHSCSYNSVEELSETSEREDEGEVREEKDLYYLGMDYPAEDEESEEEEEPTEEEIKIRLEPTELRSAVTCGFSPLYLPQFRTAPCTRQRQESEHQL